MSRRASRYGSRFRRAGAGRRGAGVLLAASALLLAGCGIRPTTVPVDAGAAPSRIGCVLPGGARPAPAPKETVVRTYLICGSRVSPVQRSVPLPEGRVAVAEALLNTLASQPSATERAAGFASRVPDRLRITGGTPADPAGTLRLSMPLPELPSFVLAQIVCTLAETDAAVDGGAEDGDAVILAGPADSASAAPPRRLLCSSALRNHADAARTAGRPVRQ